MKKIGVHYFNNFAFVFLDVKDVCQNRVIADFGFRQD